MWSLGVHDLRKLAGLDEQTDEEIAAEDLAGEDLLALPHPTWEALLLGELTTDLRDAATGAGGVTGFRDSSVTASSPGQGEGPCGRACGPALTPAAGAAQGSLRKPNQDPEDRKIQTTNLRSLRFQGIAVAS
jgi:hypothetical protein